MALNSCREGWKLNQAAELFDMSEAPFVEKLVAVVGGKNAPLCDAGQSKEAQAIVVGTPA